MEGKTKSGFKFTISDDARDDMELLDALIDLDEEKISGIRNAMIRLLGDKGKKALYEHCRNKNGVVSASQVMTELKEILDAMPKEIKNS